MTVQAVRPRFSATLPPLLPSGLGARPSREAGLWFSRRRQYEHPASVQRARRRNKAQISSDSADENRFESENRAFFTRVHTAYLEIAKREPERVFVVDARGTPDQTQAKIIDIVFKKLRLAPSKAQNVS